MKSRIKKRGTDGIIIPSLDCKIIIHPGYVGRVPTTRPFVAFCISGIAVNQKVNNAEHENKGILRCIPILGSR